MISRKIDPKHRINCVRCRGKHPRQAKWNVEIDHLTLALCHQCRQLAAAEEGHKKLKVPESNLYVHDHVKNDATKLAEKFVMHKLKVYEFPAQMFVTMKHHKMHVGDITIRPVIPPEPKKREWGRKWWLEARTLVRHDLKFPFVKKVATGTVQITDKVSLALLNPSDAKWFYDIEEIQFADEAECFVFGAGAAIFKCLRKMKLIPGLATKVGLNKAGADWLKEFKAWRTGDSPPLNAELLPLAASPITTWTGCDPKRVASAHRAWETRRKQKALGRETP